MTHLVEYKIVNSDLEKLEILAKIRAEKLEKILFFGAEINEEMFLVECRDLCLICLVDGVLAAAAWLGALDQVSKSAYVSFVCFRGYRQDKFKMCSDFLAILDEQIVLQKLYAFTLRNNIYLKKFIQELGFVYLGSHKTIERYIRAFPL